MTQSMTEKVARALYDASPFKNTDGGYDEQSGVYRRSCLLLARAAIEAMREPTDAMVDAMAEHAGTIAPEYAYEAAIDAALNEEVSE